MLPIASDGLIGSDETSIEEGRSEVGVLVAKTLLLAISDGSIGFTESSNDVGSDGITLGDFGSITVLLIASGDWVASAETPTEAGRGKVAKEVSVAEARLPTTSDGSMVSTECSDDADNIVNILGDSETISTLFIASDVGSAECSVKV
jgi:hypothetical protein